MQKSPASGCDAEKNELDRVRFSVQV